MAAKLGGKTHKQYGKRGFSRLFCHVFRKNDTRLVPQDAFFTVLCLTSQMFKPKDLEHGLRRYN